MQKLHWLSFILTNRRQARFELVEIRWDLNAVPQVQFKTEQSGKISTISIVSEITKSSH